MMPASVAMSVGKRSVCVDRQRLRTRSRQFHHAVGPDLDVRRFQIAVNDALLVGGFERLGDLPRDRERVGQRKARAPLAMAGTALEPFAAATSTTSRTSA